MQRAARIGVRHGARFWAQARATNYSARPRSGRPLFGEALAREGQCGGRDAGGWGSARASTRLRKPGSSVSRFDRGRSCICSPRGPPNGQSLLHVVQGDSAERDRRRCSSACGCSGRGNVVQRRAYGHEWLSLDACVKLADDPVEVLSPPAVKLGLACRPALLGVGDQVDEARRGQSQGGRSGIFGLRGQA